MFITIRNIIVFLSVVIPRGIPPTRWVQAYQHIRQMHQMRVRQELTRLTMEGKIKRRIVDGEFVYYPIDDE